MYVCAISIFLFINYLVIDWNNYVKLRYGIKDYATVVEKMAPRLVEKAKLQN